MKSLFLVIVFAVLNAANSFSQTSVTSADGETVQIKSTERIITIGGSITETVYALSKGEKVVATDASSTFPRQIFELPRVPYVRNLTAEGILSLSPSLIISSDDANPKSAIDQIRSAGTDMLLVKEEESLEGVIHKISVIGKALGADKNAQKLIEENIATYEKAEQLRSTLGSKPKVMFVLAVRGTSNFMIAGANTGASAMIELAGGENAFDSFSGYKQATMESILAANPDYVLMMQSRFDEISSGLKNTPGISSIKAVSNDHLIGMDGNYLLGFGPRFGAAILDLMKLFHPELSI